MLISVKDVSKIYKMGNVEIVALNKVNLNLNRGDFVCLMGPSGSGKTTLLNIIGCIEKSTSGSVVINNENTDNMNDRQLSQFRNKHIGYIFQSFNLISVLNVFENVEYPLLIRGKKVEKDLILKVIESVGLKDYIHHRPDELSGGQRQRVAIARALVTNPDIIIADEPTANLDSKTGEKIINLLIELNETFNTTLIFSTHNELLSRYAKTTLHILDGKLKHRR